MGWLGCADYLAAWLPGLTLAGLPKCERVRVDFRHVELKFTGKSEVARTSVSALEMLGRSVAGP